MSEMEDTRKDLANKVEKLEEKLAGTVEKVSETVSAVTENVEQVKETIEETVQAVTGTVGETVETVTDSVSSAVEKVKSFFDIPYQVDRHPWSMMGGSMLLGYLGGRLLPGRRAAAEEVPSSLAEAAYHPAAALQHNGVHAQRQPPREEPREEPARAEEPPKKGWLSQLSEQFGDELSKLKGLAVGTLMGVARDMVSEWIPESIKEEVVDTVNGFTARLGGKVIPSPVLDRGEEQEEEAHGNGGHSRKPATAGVNR